MSKSSPASSLFDFMYAALSPGRRVGLGSGTGLPLRLLLLASMAINMLSLALPLMALQVYDRIIAQHGMDTLNALTLAVLVAMGCEGVLRYTRSYITGWVGCAHEHNLAMRSLKHALAVPPEVFSGRGAGAEMQRFASISKLREFYGGQALVTLFDLPFIAMFLLLVWYLGGPLVFVAIALLVLFAFRTALTGRSLKQALTKRDKADDRRYDGLLEILWGIHTVKSFGAEDIFLRRYEALQRDSAINNIDVATASADAYNEGITFSQLMTAGVVLVGAPLAAYAHMTMGSLIACVLLAGRIMQPVQRLMSLWARFQEVLLAEEKINELLKIPTIYNNTAVPATRNEGLLELKNVSFGYANKSDLILRNISLSLTPGNCIAIGGAQDSGRSTLIKLMCGLLKPAEGQVTLNGLPVHELPSNSLARQIAYMPTQGVIFRGTIRDNLSRFGMIDEAAVAEMCQLLGLDDAISHLPKGYETLLENTVADPLAPGLKQRITIARVLASKPRVLLYDNADRALDREGYNRLFKLFGRLRDMVTIVMVTDDFNLLSLAGQRYTLENGQLLQDVGRMTSTTEHSNKELRL